MQTDIQVLQENDYKVGMPSMVSAILGCTRECNVWVQGELRRSGTVMCGCKVYCGAQALRCVGAR